MKNDVLMIESDKDKNIGKKFMIRYEMLKSNIEDIKKALDPEFNKETLSDIYKNLTYVK